MYLVYIAFLEYKGLNNKKRYKSGERSSIKREQNSPLRSEGSNNGLKHTSKSERKMPRVSFFSSYIQVGVGGKRRSRTLARDPGTKLEVMICFNRLIQV